MKTLVILAVLTLPVVACANSFKVEERSATSTSNSAIIAQKAEESGVSFVSNNQEYKLILGGAASKKDNGNVSSLSAGMSSSGSSSSLWQGTKGVYNLFIKETFNIPLASSLSNTNDYYQIGYNPRTKGIAIISGKIIITYTADYPPELIAERFNINLIDHFPSINVAFFTVPPSADIFTTTNAANQSGMVIKAEIEVLENVYIPL